MEYWNDEYIKWVSNWTQNHMESQNENAYGQGIPGGTLTTPENNLYVPQGAQGHHINRDQNIVKFWTPKNTQNMKNLHFQMFLQYRNLCISHMYAF